MVTWRIVGVSEVSVIYIYIDDDDDDDDSRDEGPRYRYWVVGRTRGRQRARGQISTSEGR